MIGMRRWVGFLMAFVLAAFALPALAHGDDTINLVMGVAGPNKLTASVKHNDYGDQMKSLKIPFGTNIQGVTVASVSISPNPPSTLPTVSVTGSGATGLISIASGMTLKYGQTLSLTLNITPSGSASCGSSTSTWTATGWDSSNFNGEKYPLKSTGNVLTATVNGACTLTYSAGTGGTISGISPQAVAYGGSGSTVTAVQDTGYSFVNWSDGVTTAARTDTNVIASKSVTANFAINTYTLNYNAGTGGTISGTTPQTVNYNASGSPVTAVPATGYSFASWSDGVTTAARTDTGVTASKTVTATFVLNTSQISSSKTSAVVGPNATTPGPSFSVTVKLIPAPADGTQVTLSATGATCPSLGPASALAATTTGGSAPFLNLAFTGAAGTCTLTGKATGYPDAVLTPFVVYAAGDLNCNSASYPTSAGTGATDGPLDPDADAAFVGDPLSWGLRRYTNLNAVDCTGNPVNYTLTTGIDPGNGKPATNMTYDKGNPPQEGNFKYVIVWPSQPISAWPELRPEVAWVIVGGVPQYVPGLACLSDNPLNAPSAIMPNIPDVPPFTGNADYPPNTPAKMCIAQVGWTPVGGGLVQFWTKVIDQSDGFVRQP